MALGPQNQRDQILTAIAIVAFGLVGAFWYFVYDPNTANVDALATHVDSLDEANQKAKAQLAKGTVEQIRAEAAAFRENLSLMRTLVPAGNEVPALLEQVSTAARRAKFDLAGFEPEPVIEGEMFDTYRYRVKINGAYHDIAQALANIASLSRIVSPMNLGLQIPQGQPRNPPGKQILQSTFEIQTYVVRTAPPTPKSKPGGG
ncbi:MAG TPA: type 4a pilus biogenesis protein PilO [Gemmatimonadaceae bacterium]|nr:type 4a pilus biogenesis protein PilO [Gemmatimonadaceae bacterium]